MKKLPAVLITLLVVTWFAVLIAAFSTPSHAVLQVPSKGLRVGDIYSITTAHNQMQDYAVQTVVAVGTTQANALQTVQPLVFINTSAASTGINLLKCNPGQVQHVTNQSGQTITAYAFRGSTDTINATAGSTGVTMANNTAALFVCPVSGKWGKQP